MLAAKRLEIERSWDESIRTEVIALRDEYGLRSRHEREKMVDSELSSERASEEKMMGRVEELLVMVQEQQTWKAECHKVVVHDPNPNSNPNSKL